MTDAADLEIRPMAPADADDVRRIAQDSLKRSYADIISTVTIHGAVAEWYSPQAFDDYFASDEMLFLVAVDEGDLVGFSQSHVIEETDKGRILWLHVDPRHRGRGIARAIFGRTREALHDRGIDRITALVIADHREGNEFYRDLGFQKLGDRRVEIGGEPFVENIYGEPNAAVDAPQLETTESGEELYLDTDDWSRGSAGLFYAVYRDPNLGRRLGWFCTNCGSTDNAMDSMGRIMCNRCGNKRKATRWDAAYL